MMSLGWSHSRRPSAVLLAVGLAVAAAALVLAGCGPGRAATPAAATSTTTTVASAVDLRAQFDTDNGPFTDAVRANAGFPAIEQAAGDAARLLEASTWPEQAAGDVARLVAAYRALAGDGADYNAVSAGLTAWHEAYNALAADVGAPQMGGQ